MGTWTDTAGNVQDQIGVVIADGPIHNGKDALGIKSGDSAFFDAGGETYVGNDGRPYDAMPVFYPETDTYEDAAGSIHAVTEIGQIAAVDFTGWSAGSEAGVYTDGDTGGKLPTGCTVNMQVEDGDSATLEITEATHTRDGIEAITISLTATGAGCTFEIDFPNGTEGVSASPGQTWRASACACVDASDATPEDATVGAYCDADTVDTSAGPIQEGGNLSSSLRTAQGATPAETTFVVGYFNFFLPAGTVTITMALKLEQVS